MSAPPTLWFGSDFHFGHERIIGLTNRPFTSVDHQDATMIDAWNAVVKPGDITFVVGDFSFHTAEVTSKILKKLNGQKHLIKGNHDHAREVAKHQGWLKVHQYLEQRIEGHKVVMSHFPMLSWNQMHRGAYHLHGHSHGNLRYPESLIRARILDVGVDNLAKLVGAYRPISFEEMIDLMSLRDSVSVDHHEVKAPIP